MKTATNNPIHRRSMISNLPGETQKAGSASSGSETGPDSDSRILSGSDVGYENAGYEEKKPIEKDPAELTVLESSFLQASDSAPSDSIAPTNWGDRVKRWILVVAGVLFVLLAGLGVVLPGLPATGPLILASICLTKSSPRLEQRLVRSRFFAPFQQYLEGNARMPLKAKLIAMAMMWACIIISSFLMVRSGNVANWFIGLMILSGILGTFVIARFRKNAPFPDQTLQNDSRESPPNETS